MTTQLNPSHWPHQEVARLLAASTTLRGGAASSDFRHGCVVGSTSPVATYAGRKALESGGTALDAALTTAFTQIAHAAGCWVSFAGILTMVHYDAATGQVASLNAGFRTFREESDPASIPAAPEPSGRTALVPGFFAGAWAAHQRFGRLAWAELLAPAIWVTDGVPLSEPLATLFAMREPVLARTPEARAALLPKGTLPRPGETFVQAELGATLRKVAAEGIEPLYRGEWAKQFVDVVRRHGGNATLEDLSSYEPVWSVPATGGAYGYTLHALGSPDTGGAGLVEGMKVAEALQVGDIDGDPKALHLLVQVARSAGALGDVPAAERVSDEHAERVAKMIRETGKAPLPSVFAPGSHSDFVVAADDDGNMVAICHSINTAAFGSSGLFVGGVSIPDAACFQQPALAQLEVGDLLPNGTNPTIVLKDGEPVLACSSIGAGLVETTLTCVHRHLAHRVPLHDVVLGTLLHGPDYGAPIADSINNDAADDEGTPADPTVLVEQLRRSAEEAGWDARDVWSMHAERSRQCVTGRADADAVATHGTQISVKPTEEQRFLRGYWGGISVDPVTGWRTGARTGMVNAGVEGY